MRRRRPTQSKELKMAEPPPFVLTVTITTTLSRKEQAINSPTMRVLSTVLLLVAASSWRATGAFLLTPPSPSRQQPEPVGGDVVVPASRSASFSSSLQATATNGSDNSNVLDVVLFGVGDLRADDHLGLQRALQEQEQQSCSRSVNNAVLPLLVLTDDMLRNLPGAVAHTVDTASLLEAAVWDLDAALQEQLQLAGLHTVTDTDRPVLDVVQDAVAAVGSYDKIRLHVCDLGPADNAIGYGALGQLQKEGIPNNNNIEIVTWDNGLRSESGVKQSDEAFVRELSDVYPEYEAKYVKDRPPQEPVSVESYTVPKNSQNADPTTVSSTSTLTPASELPTEESVLVRLMQVLRPLQDPDRVGGEIRTGLYGTHWGGLKANTVGGRTVLQKLQTYTAVCNEDEQAWMRHAENPDCRRNPRSLEHASMEWQLRGKQQPKLSATTTSENGTTNNNSMIFDSGNWLAGEAMTRYLAAPLFFGTVSPRRVWHAAREENLRWFSTSPLRRLIEGQEWHRLLAARNMAVDENYRGIGETTYQYWRYHGFLCRYAVTDFVKAAEAKNEDSDNKEGIMLIHGFGASGAQWNKAMQELAKLDDNTAVGGLAPDMLGFGQSEKPAVSYTGYMWDSQMLDFAKEVAVHQHGWTAYVTGGNSIGGFTSLSLAACDKATTQDEVVTSSGAPGTNRCTGLVLMNSAGPVKTADEIAVEAAKGFQTETIAQATAQDGLPASAPPPRPVGRAFGNVLLGYLRPRIQSICVNLYPTNPAAVDEVLCEGIRRDSLDPGAISIMMAGAKLPAPRTANELLGADFGSARQHTSTRDDTYVAESWFDGPVLIAQGVLDPLNDAADRMQRYGALRAGIVTDAIQAGHCPHDECPAEIAQSIARWMPSRSAASFRQTTPTKTAAMMSSS